MGSIRIDPNVSDLELGRDIRLNMENHVIGVFGTENDFKQTSSIAYY